MSEERLNEIKDILLNKHLHCYLPNVCGELLDYITNLQQKYDTAIFVGKELNKSLEDYKSRNEKTTNKIELLIKDLKNMQKLEKETGKEHFTLELFSIRIKEIYKLLQGSDKSEW